MKTTLKTSLILRLLLALVLGQTILINAQAEEQLVVKMKNEENPYTYHFVLETEDDGVIKAFHMDEYSEKGALLERVSHGVENIYKDGIVVQEQKGRQVVVLKSDNFAEHQGGELEIDTLRNGVNGERKSYHFELEAGQSKWELKKNDKKVSELFLKSKKVFLIGTVGIDKIIAK